jgi:hypothetical protein
MTRGTVHTDTIRRYDTEIRNKSGPGLRRKKSPVVRLIAVVPYMSSVSQNMVSHLSKLLK